MARNLASAGHDVRHWNRTSERAKGPGVVCGTPSETTEDADVLITMLSDGPPPQSPR